MVLTKAHLQQLRSRRGKYRQAPVMVLGVPFKKGWMDKLIGQEVDEDLYRFALSLRECRLANFADAWERWTQRP